MANYICTTCGVQYPESKAPPDHCVICNEERQYVGPQGQQWTTLSELGVNHRNVIREQAPHLYAIGTEPSFAIGQCAFLVQAPAGNVLWDCLSLIDRATVEAVNALGGISAIAISHPHFYSSMVEWSRAFGNVPIYVHAADHPWVMRSDPAIRFWSDEALALGEGLTLVHCGGHFEGSSVLHWANGADNKGVLFTGDTIYVAADRRFVSFMYSYPNLIPLNPTAIRRILNAIEPYTFDRLHGAWFDRVVGSDAKNAVARSAARYLEHIGARLC